MFASELVAGRLSVVSSWPDPHTLMVTLGGDPYVVDVRDPDRWGRLDVPGARLLVYEGAPHGLFLTHQDRLNADLLASARGG